MKDETVEWVSFLAYAACCAMLVEFHVYSAAAFCALMSIYYSAPSVSGGKQ